MQWIKYYPKDIAYNYNDKQKPKGPTPKRKLILSRNRQSVTRWISKNHPKESARLKVRKDIINKWQTLASTVGLPVRTTTRRWRIL